SSLGRMMAAAPLTALLDTTYLPTQQGVQCVEPGAIEGDQRALLENPSPQPGKDRTRRQFDMQAHPALVGGAQGPVPVDDAAHIEGKVIAQSLRVGDGPCGGTAEITQARRTQLDLGERLRQLCA